MAVNSLQQLIGQAQALAGDQHAPIKRSKQRPPGQGLQPRLLAWFNENPTEALSAADVAVKFDVTITYARNALSILGAEGAINRSTIWQLRRPQDLELP